MQPQETGDRLPEMSAVNAMPQNSANPAINGVAGFSHGAFNSNRPSIGGFRDRQGAPIPAINTGRDIQNHALHHAVDGQTPATAYDMNYTPLLPSQLLMGSPFQPGSPSTFATPQFPSFPHMTPIASSAHAQNHAQPFGSPVSPNQPLSPQYHNMLSAASLANPHFFPKPQFHHQNNFGALGHGYGQHMGMGPGLVAGTSRTVYLGNIPPDTSAEEILGHVRSGQIESVRLLPDKNCAFISFLDSSSAVHFHSDAILKKLSIRGQDIKIGWGKPSQVPSAVALAVQQSGASRNVYLGNLPAEITEEEIRADLGKFGAIDTVKMVREKSIAFVHFLSISNAIKAVNQLPQEPSWQPPRRVFYGKDRCAYISKTQQQNAAQYLGIAPGFAHVLGSADRDVISNALAQQSVAAAAVATAAGGVNNLGNRTVYLGNIHPETTTEEICNVVRGGLLHHIRYIPDKHICFVTFIDPTSTAAFFANSNMQGLMIHNRRLKIGWGKHSQALPPAIALAVSGGASRNVYIGNIDESWTEERLRQDFSEYGEIELVNTLREKSCAFVNFTNIANAIKAIEGIREKEEYKRFKINFGKDRCGNPPRQLHNTSSDHLQQQMNHTMLEGPGSPTINGGMQMIPSNQPNSSTSPSGSGASRGPGTDSNTMSASVSTQNEANSQLAMYPGLGSNQSQAHVQQPQQGYETQSSLMYGQNQDQNNYYNGSYFASAAPVVAPSYSRSQSHETARVQGQQQQQQQHQHPQPQKQQVPGGMNAHNSSNSFSVNQASGLVTGAPTIGGMLAPSNAKSAQHSRAISLPAFSQYYNQGPQMPQQAGYLHGSGMAAGTAGTGVNGYGLAIHGEGALPRWAEEEVGS